MRLMKRIWIVISAAILAAACGRGPAEQTPAVLEGEIEGEVLGVEEVEGETEGLTDGLDPLEIEGLMDGDVGKETLLLGLASLVVLGWEREVPIPAQEVNEKIVANKTIGLNVLRIIIVCK